MQKDTIVYIGNFPFPSASGVGNRVQQNVRLLRSIGYDVVVIATDPKVALGKSLSDTKKWVDDCEVYALPLPDDIKQRLAYRRDLKQVKALLEVLRAQRTVRALFFTGTKFSLFASGLVRYCKKVGIKTVADSMDWLAIHSQSLLFNVIKRFDIFWEMHAVNTKADGVLAISSYLSEYYKKRGLPTVVIPPLFEQASEEATADPRDGSVSLIYAGTPFSPNVVFKKPQALKDRLDRMIDLLYHVKVGGCKNFVFDIYGISAEDCKRAFPWLVQKIELLSDNLCFHGRVDYSTVEAALKRADFTFLIRDLNRETQAGFPSKVAESICYGVPVIISDVADHGTYIHNGTNGFLLPEELDASVSLLRQILTKDGATLAQLKANCREDKQFVYTTYMDAMQIFLKDVL